MLCSKHDPCQGIINAKRTHFIIEVKAHARVNKLSTSSFTYTINLSSRLYDNKRSMVYATIAIPSILVTSKNRQGPHYEFMKLIIGPNVSCLDLNIHKSKETIVITHESKVNIAYCSLFLATNERLTCWTFASNLETLPWQFWCMTKHLNNWLSITNFKF